jgi:hypothetical protein
MLGQQLGSGIGGLFTLTQYDWCRRTFSQVIKAQERAWLR